MTRELKTLVDPTTIVMDTAVKMANTALSSPIHVTHPNAMPILEDHALEANSSPILVAHGWVIPRVTRPAAVWARRTMLRRSTCRLQLLPTFMIRVPQHQPPILLHHLRSRHNLRRLRPQMPLLLHPPLDRYGLISFIFLIFYRFDEYQSISYLHSFDDFI